MLAGNLRATHAQRPKPSAVFEAAIGASESFTTDPHRSLGTLTFMSMGDQFKKIVRRAVLAYQLGNRRRKADRILAFLNDTGAKDVLLIGATGDEDADDLTMAHSGLIEKVISAHHEVKMGINVEPANTTYPFMIADARDMPFEDDYADFALANAIIEHVGHEAEQRQMVDEMTRVARSWVITTPNKWFPVESHTSTVFVHWFPSWRRNRSEFTRLLSRSEFRALLPVDAELFGAPWSPTFFAQYVK